MLQVQVSWRRVSAVYVDALKCAQRHRLIADSARRMQPFLPHGMTICDNGLQRRVNVDQHCIFSWLRQESSQEKCPMCRQRMYISHTQHTTTNTSPQLSSRRAKTRPPPPPRSSQLKHQTRAHYRDARLNDLPLERIQYNAKGAF
jgi:hypothetical protein